MKRLEQGQLRLHIYSGYMLIVQFNTFSQYNLSLPVTSIFKFTLRRRIKNTNKATNKSRRGVALSITMLRNGVSFMGRNNKYGGVYQLSFNSRNEFLTLSPEKTIVSIRTKEDGVPSALCPEVAVSKRNWEFRPHLLFSFSSAVLPCAGAHPGSLSSAWQLICIKIVVNGYL